MELFRRGAIFATFFGSCLAIALLVAALGTKFWVVARARRIPNPSESDGRVHFGLFDGKKELNVAYGWRTYEIDIVSEMRPPRQLLTWGLWLGTVASVGCGLLFAALAAFFAVVNTAATPPGPITAVPGLYLWNSVAMLFDLAAVSLWTVQYYQKLQDNVMSIEDLDNMWTSAGMAHLGYSFWFVVGGAIVHALNMVAIYVGTRRSRHKDVPQPMMEMKNSGAIMLY